MPYRNPERKREWEQQHREQRNVRRRAQRLAARSGHLMAPKPAPDPVSGQKTARYIENDSWMGGRHRGRAVGGACKGGPASTASASALGFGRATTLTRFRSVTVINRMNFFPAHRAPRTSRTTFRLDTCQPTVQNRTRSSTNPGGVRYSFIGSICPVGPPSHSIYRLPFFMWY